MLNHLELTTAGAEGLELQAEAGCTVHDLVVTAQATNLVDYVACATANEQGTAVTSTTIACNIEATIQRSLQLCVGSSATCYSSVARWSVPTDGLNDTVHSCEVLAVDCLARLLTENHRLFNVRTVEQATVDTGLSYQAAAYNRCDCCDSAS